MHFSRTITLVQLGLILSLTSACKSPFGAGGFDSIEANNNDAGEHSNTSSNTSPSGSESTNSEPTSPDPTNPNPTDPDPKKPDLPNPDPIPTVLSCPQPKASEMVAQINRVDPNGANFIEISGVAFSRKQTRNGNPVMWVHNDSGGGKRIATYDFESGERIKSYRLEAPGVGGSDWEDIAIGPCVDQVGDCLYIGDIGNNQARTTNGANGRDSIKIYKFKEPEINSGVDNMVIKDGITILVMDYRGPNGISGPKPYADAESLFVDPTGDTKDGRPGDIYIATKWDATQSASARLVKYPYSKQKHNVRFHLEAVSDKIPNASITRGDFSADGSMIAMGTYAFTYAWQRSGDMTIADALAKPRCPLPINLPSQRLPSDGQFEALAIAPDGSAVLQISECLGASECNTGIYLTEIAP